jgi:hypothetical protein
MGNFQVVFPSKLYLHSSFLPSSSRANTSLTFQMLINLHSQLSLPVIDIYLCYWDDLCRLLCTSVFQHCPLVGLTCCGHAVSMIHSQALWRGLTGAWIPVTLMKWLLPYCCLRNDFRQWKCGDVMELSACTSLYWKFLAVCKWESCYSSVKLQKQKDSSGEWRVWRVPVLI